MEIPRQLIALYGVTAIAWSPVARANDSPPPAPTPRPGTLAAFARTTSLTTPDGSGPITITDDNLVELADGAVVTFMTTTAAEATELRFDNEIDPKTRERWRRSVLAQRKVIARLEAKRTTIETEIDRLERGRLDSKTLDRIAKAETKLKTADREINREKAELSRIVREARKEGAQPGWFR